MSLDFVKGVRYAVTVLVLGLVLSQFIPYGRRQSNPPVVKEPAWDNPETRELAKRACFNCHSHETVWPWYSRIAPASWLVQHDVDKGRHRLNFSDWQGGQRSGENAAEIRAVILEGEMPPLPYRLAHPEARLSAAEKERLIVGFAATISHR